MLSNQQTQGKLVYTFELQIQHFSCTVMTGLEFETENYQQDIKS